MIIRLYIQLLFIFSGVLFTLAGLAWGYRSISKWARTLCLFLAAESLTCIAYGMNLTSGTLETKLFWNHVEYLGGLFVTPLMPLLAARITGYEKKLSPWIAAWLFGIPAIGVALNWTSDFHRYFYLRVWLEQRAGTLLLIKENGAMYSVVFIYFYLLIASAGAVFAVRTIRRKCFRVEQAVILLVALLAPLLCGIPYYWLRLPTLQDVNTVHVGFILTALVLSAALFKGTYQNMLRALTESEERNRLLLGNANAIFYTITSGGRFTYVSDSWSQFLGHRAEDVCGTMYRESVLPEDVPACDAFLQKVIASGDLQSGIEYRVRHLDGSIHWHTSSIKPVRDTSDGSFTFVGVAHDITEIKRTQEALHLANEKLSALIASRNEELKAAVASGLEASASEARRIGQEIHDGICQELVGMMRMAEGLVVKCAGNEAAKQQALALTEEAGRLLRLARSVSYDLTLHDVDTLLLNEALSVFAKRFSSATGVEIELNLEPDCSALPRVAAEHIYRVVREAVVNAIRHAQAIHLWIDMIQEEGQIVISVTNDGLPLPPDTPLTTGPGLGLGQIRMRAQQLGGTFAIRRNAEGKTVVELIIPTPTSKELT